ncbi:BRO family protein [Mycetocola spongiae]|uniref:BRO family protein n=1 Tax=Mycetocola spongiae TaxID=2859226 RepID=UPI001CF4CF20|nr:BRO family protein [Mycetocola spongiae]UCR89283.1 phage antirepressor [Mycetocola spongiae]
MQNEILPFSFEGHQIRTVVIDGEPWFVARDVAAALGYIDTASAIKQHTKGVAKHHPLETLGGTQNLRVIAEPDVLRLIIGSKLPAAAEFEKLVFEEILPKIRKTGTYGVPAMLTPEQIVHQALQITAAKVAELEARALDDAPKVEYVDLFVSPDDMDTIRALGNAIGEKEGVIRDLLIGKGWIYRKHIGRRYSVSKGHTEDVTEYWPAAEHKAKFRLVPQHNAPRHHNNQVRQTLYVTPEGKTAVARLFGKAAAA